MVTELWANEKEIYTCSAHMLKTGIWICDMGVVYKSGKTRELRCSTNHQCNWLLKLDYCTINCMVYSVVYEISGLLERNISWCPIWP